MLRNGMAECCSRGDLEAKKKSALSSGSKTEDLEDLEPSPTDRLRVHCDWL